jgi:hypothetical protein
MDTQNNSAKDAKRIALGDHDNKYSASVSIVDYVGELDTDDYFRFEVKRKSYLSWYLSAKIGDEGTTPPWLTLYTKTPDGLAGRSIYKGSRWGTPDETVNITINPGEYIIHVEALNSFFESSKKSPASYNLNLGLASIVPPQFPSLANINQEKIYQVSFAPPAHDSHGSPEARFRGNVGQVSDLRASIDKEQQGIESDTVAYYKFELTEPKNVSISLANDGGDADLKLFDSSGNNIAAATNSGPDQDSGEYLEQDLMSGQYYLQIYAPAPNTSSTYRLWLSSKKIDSGIGETESIISVQHSGRRGGKRITALDGQPDVITFAPKSFKKGKPDIITGFNPNEDIILLSPKAFKGIKGSKLSIANSKKKLVKMNAGRNKTQFIYDALAGQLIFDQNGNKKGFGSGGVFAVFDDETLPMLTSANLQIV